MERGGRRNMRARLGKWLTKAPNSVPRPSLRPMRPGQPMFTPRGASSVVVPAPRPPAPEWWRNVAPVPAPASSLPPAHLPILRRPACRTPEPVARGAPRARCAHTRGVFIFFLHFWGISDGVQTVYVMAARARPARPGPCRHARAGPFVVLRRPGGRRDVRAGAAAGARVHARCTRAGAHGAARTSSGGRREDGRAAQKPRSCWRRWRRLLCLRHFLPLGPSL